MQCRRGHGKGGRHLNRGRHARGPHVQLQGDHTKWVLGGGCDRQRVPLLRRPTVIFLGKRLLAGSLATHSVVVHISLPLRVSQAPGVVLPLGSLGQCVLLPGAAQQLLPGIPPLIARSVLLVIVAVFVYLRKKRATPLGSKEYDMVSMVGVSTNDEDGDEVVNL